jgi:serine/threonine-protein kinase
MSAATADRNLLFGILAVQLDFVSKDALFAGMNAWLLNKGKSLGDILRDQGQLSLERLQLLTALVAEHLRQHGDDPQQSFAALSSVPISLRQHLAALPDEAVQRSIAQIRSENPPTPEPDADPNRTIAQPPPGRVRYRILRPHAKGGLGEVFVAEDAELGRNVALKEIQNRFADDTVSRERFVREAEITGGLEHPGIVPVYGLGTYADGRPFYAMRFIKGDNLKQAIRRFHGEPGTPPSRQFDSIEFRQLLQRFIDVCNAVAYAHSRGVLHRDLKPGNIMLGKFGETLVVDWGLAKPTVRSGSTTDRDDEPTLLPRSSGDSSSATVAGQALGTPAYMSPEQAAGRWKDLGSASDIYSLGATLYELLTGRPPFTEIDFDSIQKGNFPKPYYVNPAVPPALAAVCLKAMALEPANRYGSAIEVAREIERWLADEPVTAWREPVGVRMRRWVRKHSRLMTSATAAILVAAAGFGLLALERERARVAMANKEAETARERDIAREQKRRTRAALDTMVSEDMVDRLGSQKQLTKGQREFLQKALNYYREFAAEAATDEEGLRLGATAHSSVGYLLLALGQRAEALSAYQQALPIYESLATRFPGTPAYRSGIARTHVNVGLQLRDLGRTAEAEAEYRGGIAAFERLVGEYPPVPDYRSSLATVHNNLGYMLGDLGRGTEAESECRAAITLQEKLADEFPADSAYRSGLAGSHHNLGMLFSNTGRMPAAEAEYRAAMAIDEKLVADFPTVPEHRKSLAASHNNLGLLLANLGRREAAEAEYRAALAIKEKLAAEFPAVPDYRKELAGTHQNLGIFFDGLGQRTPAAAEFRLAIAILETLAANYPDIPAYRRDLAKCHNYLGGQLGKLGQDKTAEAEHRAASAVLEKLTADFPSVPEYRSDLAGNRAALGSRLKELGRNAESEFEYRAALAIREKLVAEFPAVPIYRANLALGHGRLGNLLGEVGRRAEQEAELRASAAIFEKLVADFPTVPAYRGDLGESHLDLANLFKDLGRNAEAESEYQPAIALFEKLAADFPTVPAHRRSLAATRHDQAVLLKNLGRHAAAEAAYRAALADFEKLVAAFPAVPDYRRALAICHDSVAGLLADTGRAKDAEAEYRAALAIREKLAAELSAVPAYLISVCRTCDRLGNLLRNSGDAAAALTWHSNAIDRLAPIIVREPRPAAAQDLLRDLHRDQAKDLDQLKRSADAMSEWDAALKLAQGADRVSIRAERARCAARQGRGDETALEVAVVAADQASTADILFECAGAMALASTTAPKPHAFTGRAVVLLWQAVAKGYSDIPHLLADPDLVPLHSRADYAALLWDIADMPVHETSKK